MLMYPFPLQGLDKGTSVCLTVSWDEVQGSVSIVSIRIERQVV
jgi:hypothetical protein